MVALVAGLLPLALGLWLLWPYWQLSNQFGVRVEHQPSRLYGASTLLERGAQVNLERVRNDLRSLGYRETAANSPPIGDFHVSGRRLIVHLRSFPTPLGMTRPVRLNLSFTGRRVDRITRDGEAVHRVLLDPPLINSYYGPDRLDRWPVRLGDLSPDLLHAVLAAEDAGFYRHAGLSPRGILRAAWVDVTGGSVRQGGSTLTQQLVKNLYLTQERTLVRKLREAVLAMLLDLRYEKDAILQAYLNEIYWGQRNGVNVMGVGSASRAYFGCPPDELTLPQAALLAGMIRGPGDYDPAVHPRAARDRRDWVLDRMVEHKWLDADRATRLKETPVVYVKKGSLPRRAPYFADAAEREAERRFGVSDLDNAGYVLLSTLSPRDQDQAESATGWGVKALEKGWEKGHRTQQPLQVALISADPISGEIKAYVGGRDYGRSQFDRVALARRQAGSAFKPVVYATAFEAGTATPATLLDDEPLTVSMTGGTWRPRNSDDSFHGWVTARQAVEHSYNVPTARLALRTGLRRIVDGAHRLGVNEPLQPVPALALGAFEVTPVEMATVYATLAAGGVRPPLHLLRGVLDTRRRPLRGSNLPRRRRVFAPQPVYLVTSILQGVLTRGTGRSARVQGLTGPLAGKTGTTNDRRDSWFAGYSPGRVTVVWVGYDDNTPTRLSGARAALPIWARFMHAVRPAGGYPDFDRPSGVVTALIDPRSGELATDSCPEVRTEVFIEGQTPTALCHLHGGWFARPLPQQALQQTQPPPEVERPAKKRRHPFRRWLRRIFGQKDKDKGDDTY
jgi:penicillin-binding protein 1B